MNPQIFKKNFFAIIFSCLLILVLFKDSKKTYASISENNNQEINVIHSENSPGENTRCLPGIGFKWTFGPKLPKIANQIEERLKSENITASVIALSYGEEDSCGNFLLYAIDLQLELNEQLIDETMNKQEAIKKVRSVIEHTEIRNLGNVRLIWQNSGETTSLKHDEIHTVSSEISYNKFYQQSTTEQSNSVFLPLVFEKYSIPEIIRKKVYIIVYDPILSNEEYLSDYLGWWDHNQLTQETIDFFYQTSRESLIYEIADFTLVNAWPTKIDGFQYTETEYLAAYNGEAEYHSPDLVDYNLIVNSPLFSICEKANQGKIDEVWIYNGPGFGFYESTLVGPNAY